MGNELSTLTTDDLQVQLKQLQKVEAETKARILFKQETVETYDFSYQQFIAGGFAGYMNGYVAKTADMKTMTTRAKRDVVLTLAKYDLFGDLTFFRIIRSNLKA